MIIKVFTIFDSAAGAYLRPFFVPERAMAERAFSDLVNDPQEPVGRHPGDYTLFQIGEFNDATGRITMRKEHENLGNGLVHVRRVVDEAQQVLQLEGKE